MNLRPFREYFGVVYESGFEHACTWMGSLLSGYVLGILVSGCIPSSSPPPGSAPLRGAMSVMAEAVLDADMVCSGRPEPDIRSRCAQAYHAARAGLLAAQSGLDAWEESHAGYVICSIRSAATSVRAILPLLSSIPPSVQDAMTLVDQLPACAVTPLDGGSDG